MFVRKELRRFLMCQVMFGSRIVVSSAALFLLWYVACFIIIEPACQEKTEAEVRARVMRHPFWRVEMSAEAINAIADTILASKDKDSLVFVSEDGELVIDTDPVRFDRVSRWG